ncbi:hypothetical protein MASR1M12_16460 [Erysipelotrichia bacterium]
MSNQPQKPSLFRKIAGYFVRFGDEPTAPQIQDRSKAQNQVPAKVNNTEADEQHEKPAASPVRSAGNDKPVGQKPAATAARTGEFPFPGAMAPVSDADKSEVPAAATRSADKPAKPCAAVEQNISIEEPAEEGEPGSCIDNLHKPKYPPIVTFRNVTKIFNPGTANEFMALKNVSFEIEDLPDIGEFIALVGPSGCGKSTVLNLIQGFQEVGPPSLGEVLVRNKPVTGPGRDRGMIFQKYSSFPHLTVLKNVMFGLQLNRESLGYSEQVMEKLAREMIAKVGMKGHEDKFPYQLSGGQQQRVAIARTLVLKPRIILMDEPFSALDEPTRIEMQELITSLWHEVEATVFIVTHSLAEAVYLSDRIFMFQANPGRLARQIAVTSELIGKFDGMTPLEVQESPKFNHFLKEITDEFLRIGGSA